MCVHSILFYRSFSERIMCFPTPFLSIGAFVERGWIRRHVHPCSSSFLLAENHVLSVSVPERRVCQRAVHQRVSCLRSCMPGCARCMCIRRALGTRLFSASLCSRPGKKKGTMDAGRQKNTAQLWSHGCIGRLKCDECMQPVPDESSDDACMHAAEKAGT